MVHWRPGSCKSCPGDPRCGLHCWCVQSTQAALSRQHPSGRTPTQPPCSVLLSAGTVHFVDNACENVAHVLPQEIVGQELALNHLTDSVCHHIAQKKPQRPLVISVHGPPGVGKTYTHLWLARAMYNQKPSTDLDCPGIHCRGYKVRHTTAFLSRHQQWQCAGEM